MPIDAVLGLQWGDEGKGKIVDRLVKQYGYEIILRFQGGHNAGHTIYLEDGTKVVLHLIPSGIFHTTKLNLIGPGVVLNPEAFKKELDHLATLGVNCKDRLFVSSLTSIIMPYHTLLDTLCCGKIGTTGRGIGPAYEDLTGRKAIRVYDVVTGTKQSLTELLADILPIKNAIISHFGGTPITIDSMVDYLLEYKELLASFMMENMNRFILGSLDAGKLILAEGAQGTLLDIIFGTYRFNTSSLVTISGLNAYCGIPPQAVRKVFGIFKAYVTRVGNGPFPTELMNGIGDQLREAGHEFGSTTGRPRRCGWLDLPLLNYACQINGVTDLIMTKPDVLSVLDTFKVNGGYETKDGKSTPFFTPEKTGELIALNEFILDGFTDIHDPNFQDLLDLIASYVEPPIRMVSHGPARDEIITL